MEVCQWCSNPYPWQRDAARRMLRGLSESCFKKIAMARVGVGLHETYLSAAALDGAGGVVPEYPKWVALRSVLKIGHR